MFGKKKKESPIRVMHYEGIQGFAADYPCTLDIQGENLVIQRIKPETTVTLPLNRVNSFTAMEEPAFMLKYHGQAASTSKAKHIPKYYLAVEYDKGLLAFWGTANEFGRFTDLQYNNPTPAPDHIEL